MAYTAMQWASIAIVNGATLSNAIDLGRIYDYLQVDLPALNSCDISLTVSKTSGGTYNTLGATSPTVNVGTGSKQEVLILGGHQFCKLLSSVTQNAARTIWYRGLAD